MVKGKNKKNKKSGLPWAAPIDFTLEDDAEEMFLKHLNENDIPNKDESDNVEVNVFRSPAPKGRGKQIVIDLHGFTVAEARDFVSKQVAEVRGKSVQVRVKIITGKGLHSGSLGGVLSAEVYSFVKERFGPYILSIEEPPHLVKLAGVPIRGHFTVVLQF